MKKKRILIFPAGSEVGLEIWNALRFCKEVEVIGAGVEASNHAQFCLDEYHVVPAISDINWRESFLTIISREKIDLVFPALDDVVVALSSLNLPFGVEVVTPNVETCLVTRSKSKTYALLKGIVRVPEVYDGVDGLKYPVFVKPDRGQGAQGAKKILNLDQLKNHCAEIKEPLICEYLPGDEYTVDCFSDLEGNLLFSGARKRNRMRNGIAVNTSTEYINELNEMAQKISNELLMSGAWFFQVKKTTKSEFCLLEVAPRISGSMAANRVLGINFPLLSVFQLQGVKVKTLVNKFSIEMDRALSCRFKIKEDFCYKNVYVDLDDTLILNGKVNLQVLQLLYFCLNEGKEIFLITRHKGDLRKTLDDFRIRQIFKEIYHLINGEKKSSFILSKDSIFIDDSFAERVEVSSKLGIATFDCSMIELLLNSSKTKVMGV